MGVCSGYGDPASEVCGDLVAAVDEGGGVDRVSDGAHGRDQADHRRRSNGQVVLARVEESVTWLDGQEVGAEAVEPGDQVGFGGFGDADDGDHRSDAYGDS